MCQLANKTDILRKIYGTLVRVFYSLLMIFPFLISVIYAFVNIFGGWERFDKLKGYDYYLLKPLNENIFVGILFCCVLFAGVIFTALLYKRYMNNFMPGLLVKCVLIFAVCFLVRIIIILICWNELQQVGDWSESWSRALGNTSSYTRYSIFPAYFNQSLYFKIIIDAFGKYAEYVALVLNVLFNSITAVCVFMISRSIYCDGMMAYVAACFYALNPTGIIYSLQLTPEHLSICFYILSVWCFISFIRNISCKKLYLLLLGGVLVGIGNSFKTFAPVILLAAFITITAVIMFKVYINKIKSLVILIFGLLLFALSSSMITNGITYLTESTFGIELDFSDSVPHFLTVGLNRQGEGQIHIGDISRVYASLRYSGESRNKATDTAKQIVIKDWRDHESEILPFFINKTIWAWQDDYIPVYYFLKNQINDSDTSAKKILLSFTDKYGGSITEFWYLSVMFCGLIGIVGIYQTNYIENISLLFTNLLIMGYSCMVLLSEAQSRYKCLVMPYICIISAYGFVKVGKFVFKRHGLL